MSNPDEHDGSIEAAAARAAASRARASAARGETTGAQTSAQMDTDVSDGVSRVKVFMGVAIVVAVLGVPAAITGIYVAVANGFRDPWDQMTFWDAIPGTWAFITSPATIVVGLIIAFSIYVWVESIRAKCGHCGASGRIGYRVCSSCGRVKANA